MPKKLLLIAKNWPEPNSTAAGRRTLDLLALFTAQDYEIHIASAAEPTPFQATIEPAFTPHRIAVNDSQFDAWLNALSPHLVVYDRYVMEEQFGWRVKNTLPQVMTLLDTSDLHCLRLAREQAVKNQASLDLYNEAALREISAIARCDLTLMISRYEMELLQTAFSIPIKQLSYLPFIVDNESYLSGKSYAEREHLVMLGGFKHEPNRDATRWLKETLWPALKQNLPKHVEMHVYGAYADHAMNQLTNPKQRFFVKGRVDDSLKTIGQYRLNLAPLRFGAGQKGKILEGWLTGTPTITTPIGAESMASKEELGYTPSTDTEAFVNTCLRAYTDSHYWQALQSHGYAVLEAHFQKSSHQQRFMAEFFAIADNLEAHRHQNFWGRLLWQNQFRASEFMSRWIELKNQRNSGSSTTE